MLLRSFPPRVFALALEAKIQVAEMHPIRRYERDGINKGNGRIWLEVPDDRDQFRPEIVQESVSPHLLRYPARCLAPGIFFFAPFRQDGKTRERIVTITFR